MKKKVFRERYAEATPDTHARTVLIKAVKEEVKTVKKRASKKKEA